MSRFLLGCLALCALALMIGQAVAEANNHNSSANSADSDGVLIIETYTASATTPDGDMQPLPDNPGVEVAPDNFVSSSAQPVMMEEDVSIEQSNN